MSPLVASAVLEKPARKLSNWVLTVLPALPRGRMAKRTTPPLPPLLLPMASWLVRVPVMMPTFRVLGRFGSTCRIAEISISRRVLLGSPPASVKAWLELDELSMKMITLAQLQVPEVLPRKRSMSWSTTTVLALASVAKAALSTQLRVQAARKPARVAVWRSRVLAFMVGSVQIVRSLCQEAVQLALPLLQLPGEVVVLTPWV